MLLALPEAETIQPSTDQDTTHHHQVELEHHHDDEEGEELNDPSDNSLVASLHNHDLLAILHPDVSRASQDFGGLLRSTPKALLCPHSSDHVLRCVHLTLSSPHLTLTPSGNSHSISGQSLSPTSGVALRMSSLSSISVLQSSAWVGAGALWEDVLLHCLRQSGLAPRSWTDYLRLSVGGTLSNAGVSGQSFRYGPQASNVEELEIVTGCGELVVCSPKCNSDLFHAVLGGLGQFGIVTRARIPLFPAPRMVRWVRVVYASFEDYTTDAESLVARPDDEAFDYVEGFAFVNGSDLVNGWETVPILPRQTFDPSLVSPEAGPVLYCLEVVLHWHPSSTTDEVNMKMEKMLGGLRYVPGLEFAADVDYVEFLTRVNSAEDVARANGTWDAPHPWLNLFVSAADIIDFDRRVFKVILKDGIGGPMLVYPLLKSKWNPNTSMVVPESEVFYLVALLRFNRRHPDGPRIEDLTAQNTEIIECCAANGYDFKVYLPGYKEEGQWRAHFGREWARFEERKARYDPMGILSPGMSVFTRKAHGPMQDDN